MAPVYGSSLTDPRYSNYGGNLVPQSSPTNPYAANYQQRQTGAGTILPNATIQSSPNPQVLGNSSALSSDILRNRFGLSDPNVINGILNDPGQRGRYENELNGLQGAELSSLNTEYDRNLADWEAQLGYAGQQKDLALQGITNAQNQLLSDVDLQKTNVLKQQDTAIEEGANVARNTQRMNRNILRSLGILNSSYAGDKLSEPNTVFGKVRADIIGQATSRIGELDSFINNKKMEFTTQIQSINQQYAQMVDQINRDIRFGDRQRADAIQAINAAYSTKKAELINGTKGIVDAAEKAKQQFVSSNLSSILQNNPDLLGNLDQLNEYSQNLSSLGSGVYGGRQQTSIYEDPRKRALQGR